MNDISTRKVVRYLDEYLFEPRYSWEAYFFEERSYARWAAFEIIERLMDRPHDPPEQIVEEFIFKMFLLSNTEDPVKRRIFTIARDTAEDILRIL